MKKYLFFIFLVGVFVWSCQTEPEAPYLTVETTQVSFSAGQNTRTVSCSANAAITAVSSQPIWCFAVVRSGNSKV